MDKTLEAVAAALGVAPLSAEQQAVLLGLTRDVAHRTERRNAPLVAYLAGSAVAQSGSSDIALKAAVAVIRSVLPPQDQPDD